ncbi:MAG: hypothetical protein QOJ64_1257 [Acidobacteriota bacterium]|nr:hypothetical protein [Acidobacteriota bacterium]
MNRFKLNLRSKFCAIAIAGLLLGVASAPAWAQHDMQNMPAMNMGSKRKANAKSRSRSTVARRKQAQKRGGMSAMNMKGRSRPSPSRASSPSKKTPVQTMDTNMPGMSGMPSEIASPSVAPSVSPQAMDMTMPGMHMPMATSSPPTTASPVIPVEKMDMSMPGMQMPATPTNAKTDQAQTPSPHDNMPGMEMPQTSGTPTATQANPHATHDNTGAMGNMNMDTASERGQPSTMAGMNMPGMVIGSNGTITSRSGSGTSWQPASTPMHMLHWQEGDWMVMVHGEAKLGVNAQGGPRGVTKLESQNWLMAMGSRPVGHGTLDLRSMFSLEPVTFSPGGSPELFQTGETYKGQPLLDKQHPHDLFMTLSASYSVPLGERGSWFAYLGFPGEPALGPTAFMHRASAAENPAAPLAHHLQDSTHISFGVFTTGFTYRWFKVEGSVFNGREPDENRYNFEFNPWSSHSARISFAPTRNWAMQVSYGLLKNPEAVESGDVRRTTASISYNKPLARGNWATTLIWGRNRENHHNQPATLNGYTAESTLQFMSRNYVYTRLELVDKNGLLNSAERLSLGIADSHPLFRIGAYTFGAARDVWETDKFSVALGGDVTFYSKPAMLDSVYGNNPTSYHFFVRFRLGRMSKGGQDSARANGANNTEALNPRPRP